MMCLYFGCVCCVCFISVLHKKEVRQCPVIAPGHLGSDACFHQFLFLMMKDLVLR